MRNLIAVSLFLTLSCSDSQLPLKGNYGKDAGPGVTDEKRISRIIYSNRPFKTGDTCAGGISIYDDKNRLSEELDYSSCGVIFKRVKYHYGAGNRVKSSSIESSFENVTYLWNYDSSGNLVETRAILPTNSFPYKNTFQYDEMGKLMETKAIMADGTAFNGTSRKQYSYSGGRKEWTICYSGQNFDVPGYRIHHIYDESGKELMNLVFKNPESHLADTGYVHHEYLRLRP